MGMIRFYEGPAATQHYIGKLSTDVSQIYDLSLISAPIPNEQALSCTLLEVQPGTKIKLYNSPVPSEDEGCTEITVLAYVEEKCVPYFNANTSDDQIEVRVHKGKGEPGKVCRIEVQSS
jgi:hypothetical protein